MRFDPSQRKSFLKQALPIALVLVVGIAFGVYILNKKAAPAADEHGHVAHAEAGDHADKEHHEDAGASAKGASAGHADDKKHADEEHHENEAAAPKKGPHGGRLFAAGDYGLELTIFETGVEPQFRIYTYRDGKPIDVARMGSRAHLPCTKRSASS